jgi:hypothetical protein
MINKYTIEFVKTTSPVSEPRTKFGGQPVWIAEPQWPMSRATGQPMMFVGQFVLFPEVFGNIAGKMAYVFMTDDDTGALPTWAPDGGENAVVIQPGGFHGAGAPMRTGPSLELHKFPFFSWSFRPRPRPFEYETRLTLGEDPDPVTDDELRAWNEDDRESYFLAVVGNKIGGTPGWVQGTESVGDGVWRLALQLEADHPLPLSFGDAGVGYAFINADGTEGRFLSQQH